MAKMNEKQVENLVCEIIRYMKEWTFWEFGFITIHTEKTCYFPNDECTADFTDTDYDIGFRGMNDVAYSDNSENFDDRKSDCLASDDTPLIIDYDGRFYEFWYMGSINGIDTETLSNKKKRLIKRLTGCDIECYLSGEETTAVYDLIRKELTSVFEKYGLSYEQGNTSSIYLN